MKFGDLVNYDKDDGIYMFVVPFSGPPRVGMRGGPNSYSWIADIKTDWLDEDNGPSVTYAENDKLYPIE